MKEELAVVEVVEFKGSNGWLDRFCKRYSLTTRRITGTGKELPSNAPEIIWDYIQTVNDNIKKYGIYFVMLLRSQQQSNPFIFIF